MVQEVFAKIAYVPNLVLLSVQLLKSAYDEAKQVLEKSASDEATSFWSNCL